MSEAVSYQMPYSLRRLFATLLVYCNPGNPQDLWKKYEDSMSEDFKIISTITKKDIRQLVLNHINEVLLSMGHNISEFKDIFGNVSFSKTTNEAKEIYFERNIIKLKSYLKVYAMVPRLICHDFKSRVISATISVGFSCFKDAVGKEVNVQLKKNFAIGGTLHSVHQYLSDKFENTIIFHEDNYPIYAIKELLFLFYSTKDFSSPVLLLRHTHFDWICESEG
ncbi:hypothetical protein H5410_042239 [Solanum commersonii]|uniref:Uncharacterized protein n=1 Tax=Solanum commersonii TaxID=4109 RepID=A0A9J5XV61_SOLCO|nr:hypothetical protein H5410_042239 [Solanum commersonii]